MLSAMKFCSMLPSAENPVSMIYTGCPPNTSTYTSSAPNSAMHAFASHETPSIPFKTAIVYTRQITIKIAIVINFDPGIPNSVVSARDKRGVATENVVAVPAIRAITARTSMIFPCQRSVFSPRIGRQASEYFCFVRLRTCSMNPKHAASIA